MFYSVLLWTFQSLSWLFRLCLHKQTDLYWHSYQLSDLAGLCYSLKTLVLDCLRFLLWISFIWDLIDGVMRSSERKHETTLLLIFVFHSLVPFEHDCPLPLSNSFRDSWCLSFLHRNHVRKVVNIKQHFTIVHSKVWVYNCMFTLLVILIVLHFKMIYWYFNLT